MAFKVLIVDDEPDLEVLIRQRFRDEIAKHAALLNYRRQ